MSEKPVCHHCGYVGPVDARYCAHCGRALVPPNVRLTRSIDHILSNLSPFHIGFLGLVLSVPISAFADRLMVPYQDARRERSGGTKLLGQCSLTPTRVVVQP